MIEATFEIPYDALLCGSFAATQAILTGGGAGIGLTNAQDLSIGFQ